MDMDASTTTFLLPAPGDAAIALLRTFPHVNLVEAGFDPSVYEDELFKRLDVEFPSSLHSAVARRRAEYLAGRACARQALKLCGREARQVHAGPDRCPQWPAGIAGSISHSERLAIAAVTAVPVLGVGVDIQPVANQLLTADELRDVVFAGADWDLLPRPGDAGEQLPLSVFSIKECLFKAAYPLVRRFFDFSSAEVLSIDWDLGMFRLGLRDWLHPSLPSHHELSGAIDVRRGVIRCLLVIDSH